MPFTPAHPAAVLPFLKCNKRFISITALVIGSMAPDFEYFFKMRVNSIYGHTTWGLLYFDVPATLLVALLFHLIIKTNLIENLPSFFQLRFNTLLQFDFLGYLKMNWSAFLVSAYLGSVSHLFWDSFTHKNGFFIKHVPFFSLALPLEGEYPIFQALQHISTVVGLIIVTAYIIRLKPDPSVKVARSRFAYWGIAILLTLIILSIRFGLDQAALNLGNLAASFITAVACALLINGFINFRRAST